jgi:hypothetical protein
MRELVFEREEMNCLFILDRFEEILFKEKKMGNCPRCSSEYSNESLDPLCSGKRM